MAALHLYALTLQRSSAITAAVYGNFSGPKQQELAVARGKLLELMRPDENGKVRGFTCDACVAHCQGAAAMQR
eukprot:6209553-Pleurochrysis_carterae.AAC.3